MEKTKQMAANLRRVLLSLKTMTDKLQGPAIFGDGANHVVGGAIGNISLDFKGYFYFGADQTDEVRYDLIGDATGIPAGPSRIQSDTAVEAPGLCLLGSWFIWWRISHNWR